jgi:transposase InsO family protein
MMNDLPPGLAMTNDAVDDAAHDAYNAAFYELGLRWHWDQGTYAALMRHSADPEVRIRHYLQTRQPHLLTAYDPAFLAAAIQERVLRYKPCAHRPFDWAQAAACEVGV